MKKLISAFQKFDLRGAMIALIGVVMSRTLFFDMNPIAIGYFAAAYTNKKSRALLTIAMLAGLLTLGETNIIVKYGLIVLVIAFVTYISEKKDKMLSVLALSILSGLITITFSISNGFVSLEYKKVILLGVLEGMLVISLANMFYIAIDFIKSGNRKQLLTNQELISLAMMGGCFVYGMPDLAGYSFSIVEAVAYLLIVVVAFKYGAGAGAVTGASCGAVLGIRAQNMIELGMQSQDIVLIAVLCIVGIGTGMFRELGKMIAGIVFALLNIVLCYFISSNFLDVGQVRALVSAVIIFFCYQSL